MWVGGVLAAHCKSVVLDMMDVFLYPCILFPSYLTYCSLRQCGTYGIEGLYVGYLGLLKDSGNLQGTTIIQTLQLRDLFVWRYLLTNYSVKFVLYAS
jgi:hypothetical protein